MPKVAIYLKSFAAPFLEASHDLFFSPIATKLVLWLILEVLIICTTGNHDAVDKCKNIVLQSGGK